MMKILCFKRTAFEHQVHKPVKIQQNRHHYLLNSRSECNRCSLPRLTVKLGNKELGELTQKLKEDQKKEDKLEKMIGEWKKMSKKRQGCVSSDQPKMKRLRTDYEYCDCEGSIEHLFTDNTPTRNNVSRYVENLRSCKPIN